MSTRDFPWYKWYPRDYMTSTKVMSLSWEEQGVYRFFLDIQWVSGGIPADLAACRMLARGAKKSAVEKVVSLFFKPHPERADLLVNGRLADIEACNQAVSHQKSMAGKRSAEARRSINTRSTPVDRPFNGTPTENEQGGNTEATTRACANSREEGEAEKEAEKEGREESPPPVSSRISEDVVRREVASLPTSLKTGRFPEVWAEWIRHLAATKLPHERNSFTIVNAQAKFCAEVAKSAGIEEACDCLEWPMREGRRSPCRRPAGKAPAITSVPPAANDESARAALAEPEPEPRRPVPAPPRPVPAPPRPVRPGVA